jgi:hypothetical protein
MQTSKPIHSEWRSIIMKSNGAYDRDDYGLLLTFISSQFKISPEEFFERLELQTGKNMENLHNYILSLSDEKIASLLAAPLPIAPIVSRLYSQIIFSISHNSNNFPDISTSCQILAKVTAWAKDKGVITSDDIYRSLQCPQFLQELWMFSNECYPNHCFNQSLAQNPN